jgi:hypothetical protein
MNLRNHRKCLEKYLQSHPYRRHSSTPTHFSGQRQSARFTGLNSLHWRVVSMAPPLQLWEYVGYSNQVYLATPTCLEMRFADGPE